MPQTRSVKRFERRPTAPPNRVLYALCVAVGLASGVPATAAEEPSLRALRSITLDEAAPPRAVEAARATYRMRLELALMPDSGRSAQSVLDAARQAAGILAQCGIRTHPVRLQEFEAPSRFRVLNTPDSRELALRAGLARPAVFFVADTLHDPKFDAEAIGRANSRTRPEMADTVWITAAARDLPVVIAHELVHVLADSGAHSQAPDNLMRAETAPGNRLLSAEQCGAILAAAAQNDLLRAIR